MSLENTFNTFIRNKKAILLDQWVDRLNQVVSGESSAEKNVREKAKDTVNSWSTNNSFSADQMVDTDSEYDLLESLIKNIDGDNRFNDSYLDSSISLTNENQKIEAYLTKDIFEKDGTGGFTIKQTGLFHTSSADIAQPSSLTISASNLDPNELPLSILSTEKAQRITDLVSYFSIFKNQFAELGITGSTDINDIEKFTKALNEIYEAAILKSELGGGKPKPKQIPPTDLLKTEYRVRVLDALGLIINRNGIEGNKAKLVQLIGNNGIDAEQFIDDYIAVNFSGSFQLTNNGRKYVGFKGIPRTSNRNQLQDLNKQRNSLGELIAIPTSNDNATKEAGAKDWIAIYSVGIGERDPRVIPKSNVSGKGDGSIHKNLPAFAVQVFVEEVNNFENTESGIQNLLNQVAGLDVTGLSGLARTAAERLITTIQTLDNNEAKNLFAGILASSIKKISSKTTNRQVNVEIDVRHMLSRVLAHFANNLPAKENVINQILAAISGQRNGVQEVTLNLKKTQWDQLEDGRASVTYKIMDEFFNTRNNPNNSDNREPTLLKDIVTEIQTRTSTISNSDLTEISKLYNRTKVSNTSNSRTTFTRVSVKLNVNEVHLDSNLTQVSNKEARFRETLKIHQQLIGSMKVTDPNSWINKAESSLEYGIISALNVLGTPSNHPGKAKTEAIFKKNALSKTDYAQRITFDGYSVYGEITDPDIQGYLQSLKDSQTDEYVNSSKLASAQDTLKVLKGFSDEDWQLIVNNTSYEPSKNEVTKPNDLDSWTAEAKTQEILDLGEKILNSSSIQGNGEDSFIYTMTPDPKIVKKLKVELDKVDPSTASFAQKKQFIQQLSSQELLILAHGFEKYIYDKVRSWNSLGNPKNLIFKEVLLAEIGNSDSASSYYLEAMKVGINAISELPPAKNKLKINEVALDQDKSISSTEQTLQKIIALDQKFVKYDPENINFSSGSYFLEYPEKTV
ncbi:MAG: hypothetical protein QNJ31_01720 [Candidatus Caenarcaniphilales bacterium]|nr:hypothetical protein [Candidatus Caenarcaniphilales bacterium]